MKRIFLFLLMMIVFVSGCNNQPAESNEETNAESQTETSEIKVVNFDDIKGQDVQIIDIRHPDLYLGWGNSEGKGGHIEGAMDFPVSWLKYETNPEFIDIELQRRHLDKEKKTVIYEDGDVTEENLAAFSKLGFKDLNTLKGGFNQYIADGNNSESLPGYERYVGTQWVQDVTEGKKPEGLVNDKVKIVEIILSKEEDAYKNGHIEGAISLFTDDINHKVGPRTLADYDNIPMEEQLTFWKFKSDDEIKTILENAGITHDTTVILYASYESTTAANRAALVMDYAGVKDIRIMNGGKKLWELENRPLTKEVPEITPVEFGITIPQHPEIVYTYDQEIEMVDDPNAVIASVRSWEEYLGNITGYTYMAVTGDIENSRFAYAGSDPYAMEDFRNIDNTMFNYKLVEERWARWGITPDKTVSFHCGTGWRASETYYIARALGWENTGVYVGGWFEWHKRPGSPVMEKGLPKDAPEEKPEEYFYMLEKE